MIMSEPKDKPKCSACGGEMETATGIGEHYIYDTCIKVLQSSVAALRDRAERAEVEAKRYKELESAMHTEFKKVCKDRRQLEKAVEEKDALLDKQRDALASLTAQVAAKEGEIEGLRAELAAIESHPIDRHDQYESILLSLKEETAKGDTERLAKLATSHLKDAIIDASKTHQAWVMRTNGTKRWKERAEAAEAERDKANTDLATLRQYQDRHQIPAWSKIEDALNNWGLFDTLCDRAVKRIQMANELERQLSLAQTELAQAKAGAFLEAKKAAQDYEQMGYEEFVDAYGCGDISDAIHRLWFDVNEKLQVGAVDRWQSIETAPKDSIALYWLEWAKGCGGGQPISQSERVFKGKQGGWCSLYKATHWQPLPEPPIPATAAATNEEKK
jgi:hypothetical protein